MIELLSLYGHIGSADRQRFRACVTTETCAKGDYLLMDGDVQDRLYLVQRGVAMLHHDGGDRLQVMDFAYRRRFAVDIVSWAAQAPSQHCILCLEDCTVQAIAHGDLMELMAASPGIAEAYRCLLERVLGASVRRSLELASLSIQERFAKLVERHPELFALVPHKYLASYLSIDPTNFSKLYHRFAETHRIG